MTKQQLRESFLAIRKGIRDKESKSNQIAKRLLSMDVVKNARSLLFLQSLGSEVDTYALAKDLLALQKTVWCVVVIDGETFFTEYSANWHNNSSLLSDDFGAKYEAASLIKDYPKVEVAILPGVAFSPTGVRLGYGGGYLDQLLAKLSKITKSSKPSNIYKIGLAFEGQIEKTKELDNLQEDHDINMDAVVTEENVYTSPS